MVTCPEACYQSLEGKEFNLRDVYSGHKRHKQNRGQTLLYTVRSAHVLSFTYPLVVDVALQRSLCCNYLFLSAQALGLNIQRNLWDCQGSTWLLQKCKKTQHFVSLIRDTQIESLSNVVLLVFSLFLNFTDCHVGEAADVKWKTPHEHCGECLLLDGWMN